MKLDRHICTRLLDYTDMSLLREIISYEGLAAKKKNPGLSGKEAFIMAEALYKLISPFGITDYVFPQATLMQADLAATGKITPESWKLLTWLPDRKETFILEPENSHYSELFRIYKIGSEIACLYLTQPNIKGTTISPAKWIIFKVDTITGHFFYNGSDTGEMLSKASLLYRLIMYIELFRPERIEVAPGGKYGTSKGFHFINTLSVPINVMA